MIPIQTVSKQEELLPLSDEKASPQDYIIFMGAGDITQWAYQTYHDIQNLNVSQEGEK